MSKSVYSIDLPLEVVARPSKVDGPKKSKSFILNFCIINSRLRLKSSRKLQSNKLIHPLTVLLIMLCSSSITESFKSSRISNTQQSADTIRSQKIDDNHHESDEMMMTSYHTGGDASFPSPAIEALLSVPKTFNNTTINDSVNLLQNNTENTSITHSELELNTATATAGDLYDNDNDDEKFNEIEVDDDYDAIMINKSLSQFPEDILKVPQNQNQNSAEEVLEDMKKVPENSEESDSEDSVEGQEKWTNSTIDGENEVDQVDNEDDDEDDDGLLVSKYQKSGGRRGRRSVVHLYDMVVCSTGCNPLAYKGYGCYCGFLGSGNPVDGIDKCCLKHDMCYQYAKCPPLLTYFVPYYWTCNHGRPKCISDYRSGWKGECGAHLCECDRKFAECLRRYPCPRNRAMCMTSPFRFWQNLIMQPAPFQSQFAHFPPQSYNEFDDYNQGFQGGRAMSGSGSIAEFSSPDILMPNPEIHDDAFEDNEIY